MLEIRFLPPLEETVRGGRVRLCSFLKLLSIPLLIHLYGLYTEEKLFDLSTVVDRVS